MLDNKDENVEIFACLYIRRDKIYEFKWVKNAWDEKDIKWRLILSSPIHEICWCRSEDVRNEISKVLITTNELAYILIKCTFEGLIIGVEAVKEDL